MQSKDPPSNKILNSGPFPQLDRIDIAIIGHLQNAGRISNKVLAAKVDLAPSSCLARVRRLEESGVITGYHATVHHEAMGVGLEAMIDVKLLRHTRDGLEAFRNYLYDIPEILAIYHVSGAVDFRVHVAVKNSHHLRDIALDYFTTHPEVAQIETHLIFEALQKPLRHHQRGGETGT